MKKILCLALAFIGIFGSAYSQNLPDAADDVEVIQDEVKQIEALMQATKESLVRLEKIKKLLVELKTTERACMKSPKDGKLLFKLAQAGQAAYTAIKEANLEDFFQAAFISELKKLNDLADKKTIPPAR